MDVIWEVHIFLKDTESICFSSCSINLFSNSLVWLAKYKEEKHEFLYKKIFLVTHHDYKMSYLQKVMIQKQQPYYFTS